MEKAIIILFLLSLFVGCKATSITPADMKRIQSESIARDPGLSRYADPWVYVGSDQEFDYVLHSGVMGDQDLYRIVKGKLNLERSFERTKDKSKWVTINQDGSTFKREPLNLVDP